MKDEITRIIGNRGRKRYRREIIHRKAGGRENGT